MEKRIVMEWMTCMDECYRLAQPSIENSSSESSNQSFGQVLVIGATNRVDALDSALRRPGRFDCEIYLGIPDENARFKILSVLTEKCTFEGSVDLLQIVRSTPGFVGADLKKLVDLAGYTAMYRTKRPNQPSKQYLGEEENVYWWWKKPWSTQEMEEVAITMADFEEAAKEAQPSSKREGFSPIPDVKWEDVGGLDCIKDKFGLELKKGILLNGPPGCGKTMIAQAAANEAGANFIHIKGPELLNKYVGQSELEVRTLFNRARTCSPCIIFFDEVDALLTMRGKDEGSISDRVVAQFLTELDGGDKRHSVFVIGATNRLDMIDPAIKRSGRFSRHLFIPLPSTKDRGMILKALAKGKPIDPSVDLDSIGRMGACNNFSGADLHSLMQEAVLCTVLEFRKNRTTQTIKTAHFEEALAKISKAMAQKMWL